MKPHFYVEYRRNDQRHMITVPLAHAATADQARSYVMRTIPGAEVLHVMDVGVAFWLGSLLIVTGFCLTIRGIAPIQPSQPVDFFVAAVGAISFITGLYLQHKFD